MTHLYGFALGVIGGVVPEIYALYKLRHDWESNKPKWVTSRFYWSVTAVMILLGGGTVCLYLSMGVNVNELMAIHLGVATPVLIASVIKEKPKID
ncbi:MAG TPA: hypothetical protein VI298_00890 [Geobacteraceae bacterium]